VAVVYFYGAFEILPPRQNFLDDSYVKIAKIKENKATPTMVFIKPCDRETIASRFHQNNTKTIVSSQRRSIM
jgi:hypothetical protein